MISHGEHDVIAEEVDVPALLRDVAQVSGARALRSVLCAPNSLTVLPIGARARTQHHRMSPAAGVSISVSVAAGGLSLVSNASHIAQVLEDVMERACHEAACDIFLAAAAAAAGSVLFTVTYDTPMDLHGSHHLDTAGDKFRHAVGVESVPTPVRGLVVAQLRLAGAPELSADTYVLHGRGRRGGGATATVMPTAATALPGPGGTVGTGWRSYQRAVALTAALGGHMGVARVEPGGYTRIWLLLPALMPLWPSVAGEGAPADDAALGPLGKDREEQPDTAARTSAVGERKASAAAMYAYPRTRRSDDATRADAVTVGLPQPAIQGVAADAATGEAIDHVVPAPVVDASAAAAAMASSSTRPRVRRVLFVDDEAVLRRLVARMLERLGVPYDALEDGSEVTGALRPEHDLILLDIVMKHSDGAQVRALSRPADANQRLCLCAVRFDLNFVFYIP